MMKKDLVLVDVTIKNVPYFIMDDEVCYSLEVAKKIDKLIKDNPYKTVIDFEE